GHAALVIPRSMQIQTTSCIKNKRCVVARLANRSATSQLILPALDRWRLQRPGLRLEWHDSISCSTGKVEADATTTRQCTDKGSRHPQPVTRPPLDTDNKIGKIVIKV